MAEQRKASHAEPVAPTNGQPVAQTPPRHLTCSHLVLSRPRPRTPVLSCGACGLVYIVSGNAVVTIPPDTIVMFVEDLLAAMHGSSNKATRHLQELTQQAEARSKIILPGG